MLSLDIKTIIAVIIFGYLVSGIIFFLYAYLYQKRNLKIILYAFGKALQFFAWTLYAYWGENLTGNRMALAGTLIITSATIEVFSIILISTKNIQRPAILLSAIVILASLVYTLFRNDVIIRVFIMSVTIAFVYSYLFVHLTFNQNTSKMQKVIGWFAFIFVVINLIRGLFSYLSHTEIPLYSDFPIQAITGFSWIVTGFALPLLFLFALIEKDTIKLNNYKRNLENIVDIRTKKLKDSLLREKELGVLKTNFVSMASHEFRTPLAAINATVDVIQRYNDKLSKDDVDQRLNKIKNEIHGMTTMLEDLLIIGKSDSQKLNFNPIKFNLIENIKNIISEYQLSQTEKRTIIFHKPDNEIIANADPKWIKHIVVNLLSNAIKYSESDKPVEINILSRKNEIEFSFKDYGIGIPKEDLKNLFESFHRGKNVGSIAGTGLGLAVVFKATELHGGAIDVTSEIDKGSTFTVTLPQ